MSARALAGPLAVLILLVAPGGALAMKHSKTVGKDGTWHLHYQYGPLHIAPGQNTIEIQVNKLKPSVPGFITRFAPNLKRPDGSVPRVDVIHLHHGVWLVGLQPTFAAGEE